MNRVAILLAVIIAALGAALYYYVLDGALPAESDFPLDIAEIRKLAAAPGEKLPIEIRMETLARTPAPSFALRAGAGFGETIMARVTFQVVTPDGDVIIEAGMDRALAVDHQQEHAFDDAVWADIQSLMANAKMILVTHEHPDHIGGLVRAGNEDALAETAVLTRAQYDGLTQFAEGGVLSEAWSRFEPIALDGPTRLAPGIVKIPSAGHTPGSVMFYVALASGREFLFIGDIAYTEENVIDGVDRPRLTRNFMVTPEDRSAVVHQLRALHDLSKAEPDFVIIPAHADALFERLSDEGVFEEGFAMTDRNASP